MKHLLFLVALLAPICVDAGPVQFVHGVASIDTQFVNSDTIEVVIHTERFSAFPFKETYMWGGYLKSPNNRRPKVFISAMLIRVGKKEVVVPVSAFSDLADPLTLDIEHQSKDVFLLIINGSETSEGYTATLRFERDFLKWRKVFNRNFPMQAWSETVYSRVENN